VDRKRLGIMGTSLGSFLAALTAEMEPKLGRVAVVLGGGGFVDAYWDHPKVELLRRVYEAFGGTKEQMAKLIAPVDPLTYAANLKGRKLLILAARRDEVVPPRMAEALWNATGRQQIIWYDTTHFGAVFFLVPGMQHVVRHFSSEK
jgi:cephalosporin-C deacetylase-like acetyl esterase